MSRETAQPAAAMQAEDFRRALAQPPRARSEHFSLHAVARSRGADAAGAQHAGADLSTPMKSPAPEPVEETARLGFVLPKRLARRAVTRNLLRRQGRAVWSASPAAQRGGDWVIRLARPFDPASYRSAASSVLRLAVRAELEVLIGRALERKAARVPSR